MHILLYKAIGSLLKLALHWVHVYKKNNPDTKMQQKESKSLSFCTGIQKTHNKNIFIDLQ
jgi:hypothetical protein